MAQFERDDLIISEIKDEKKYNPLKDILDNFDQHPLKDILNKGRIEDLVKENITSIFPVYKSKTDVALDIFHALNSRILDLGNGKLGIPMEDGEKKDKRNVTLTRKQQQFALTSKVGLLSQCQGLQTLVSLVNDFGLEFDVPYDTVNNRTIRNIMDGILKDIINKLRDSEIDIDRDEEDPNETLKKFVFDASPYDSEHFSTEIASIETITWVLPTFFQILTIHAKAGQICKWENNLISIIRHGLKYLNEAYIDDAQNSDSKSLKIGWNFTKNCEEPSLYFTFTVGECFLDMFNTFEEVLKHPYNVLYNKIYHTPIDEEIEQKYEAQKELYKEEEKENAELDADKARHNPYNELARLFRLIALNDDESQDPYAEISVDSTNLYGSLAEKLKNVARKTWELVKDDLADQFFYNDLNKQLSEAELRMSTTSDALFNTVYIVNILIDSGLDEILLYEKQEAELKSNDINRSATEREEQKNIAIAKQREYENLLESCQLAVQRAFRTYDSLKNAGKDYIVDQFLIGFNERFVYHKDIVGDLRKLRMRVFSLLPMLIHTNNVINAYLVKYPQINMQKYTGYILDNRFSDKSGNEAAEWIWEKDGYFSGSNCYFVTALKEFYDYLEAFETDFIANSEKNEIIERDFLAKHSERGGKIYELKKQHEDERNNLKTEHEKQEKAKNKEINALNERIAFLEESLEAERNKKPTIEEAVRSLVKTELDAMFLTKLTETFSTATAMMAPNKVNPAEDTSGVYMEMFDAMLDMFVANCFGKSHNFKDASPDEYEKLTVRFKNDVRKIIGEQMVSISKDKLTDSTLLTILRERTQS